MKVSWSRLKDAVADMNDGQRRLCQLQTQVPGNTSMELSGGPHGQDATAAAARSAATTTPAAKA